MVKQRVLWIDSVKFIAMICIMGNHLNFMNSRLYAVISPVYLMPFFFCAGYTYKRRTEFKSFLGSKIRQLLIPWLILSLFNILLAQIFSFHVHKSLGEELLWNFLQIRGKDDGMWFVAALFVAYVPFYFFVNWYHRKQITARRTAGFLSVAFVFSLGSMLYMRLADPKMFPWGSPALPWHLEYMFQAMFFMVLGYIFRNEWETWFDTHNRVFILIFLVAVYLLVTCGRMQWLKSEWLSIPLTYIKQALGVHILVSFCKKLRPNRYMQYIGQNTLVCFGLHGKLCSVIEVAVAYISPAFYELLLGNALCSSAAVLAGAVFMSLVLIVPIWLINRYVPFVAGKRK